MWAGVGVFKHQNEGLCEASSNMRPLKRVRDSKSSTSGDAACQNSPVQMRVGLDQWYTAEAAPKCR